MFNPFQILRWHNICQPFGRNSNGENSSFTVTGIHRGGYPSRACNTRSDCRLFLYFSKSALFSIRPVGLDLLFVEVEDILFYTLQFLGFLYVADDVDQLL